LVLKLATPLLTLPTPSVVGPFLNVTVPVAVVELTVAVKVTDVFELAGLAEELSAIVVLALFTVWLMELLVLPLSLESPL
jgi:hypothetical protein